ncbi:MAG: tRNA uridine-5-carboxymethylaminomethyl(34) synthesis GTPase MnmE [Bacteroidetes bacterium]|nr:tRNA uridine-5-carboxymethylaminomethyl(34) synthesis GTPase MnmE [Bacteroidota bacterium]MBS1931287.1 tRNA uridine-5-carboxymethylaminomethyl(34) synthesis GTPase MnmE [Bacteroidota bacterium]
MNQHSGWEDTIVAPATAPGVSAISIIRLSGAQAFTIIDHLFPTKKISEQPSHTLHFGVLKNKDQILDEVLVSVFKTPRSYTGEDLAEISCHGSPYIVQQILDACINLGARLAKPGEFTQRAFLNGKLDLTQAEAVADLIASNTTASHKTALNAIRGGFSKKLKELREDMIRFSALNELELDFSQEDVEFADRKHFYLLISELQQTVDQLLSSFKIGNAIRNGVNVAIIGKPNAGKSTLLNVLLNEDRAIVSEIPGTTRDTIEEVMNIDGILFRLIDTAGIREHTSDVIEAAGMERSLAKMKKADLVLFLFDVGDEKKEIEKSLSELQTQQLNYLPVVNKIDREGEGSAQEKFSSIEKVIFISAKAQLNIDILLKRMVDAVLEGKLQVEDTVITNARHYHALKEVQRSLSDIRKGLDDKIPGDLLASDIRRCLYYLGEITGEITNEEQLDYIFSKFCIGK